MSNNIRPIGVFDSGVGGLSILSELIKYLPNENFLYVADSKYAPYGNKSFSYIRSRSIVISKFFLSYNVKAIVIACNTATVHSISFLRKSLNIPIIGVIPDIKTAVKSTNSGIIGLIATTATLNSYILKGLIKRYSKKVNIISKSCPLLVQLVESGRVNGVLVEKKVYSSILPLIKNNKDIDTIILGCTHYFFLEKIIKEVTNLNIINPNFLVASNLRNILNKNNLLNNYQNNLGINYFTSGDLYKFCYLLNKLLNVKTNNVYKI